MEFRIHAAPPSLQHAVAAIWSARGAATHETAGDPIVPDGCVEIVVNLGDPFEEVPEDGPPRRQAAVLVAGPSIRPTSARPTGSIDLIGVRFRPGVGSAALSVSMHQLRDRIEDAGGIIGRQGDSWRERLGEERDARGRIAFLTSALRWIDEKVIARSSGDVLVAVDAIQACAGTRPVETLAGDTGISRRHLERLFLERVGLTPKEYSRIVRAQRALALLRRAHAVRQSLLEIALECGYADQSHMTRDLTAIAGQTPAQIARAAESFAAALRAQPLESPA